MAAASARAKAPQTDGTVTTDLLVVGGGINGVGIARDAAGRGARVVLCEQADLASATSSASSKLIHGGLRYLEHFEWRLVHEALGEREHLLRAAPHLVWPMRFVLPHNRLLRPAWMIRAGLFLYDWLSRRKALEGSEGVRLRGHRAGGPLQTQYRKGFIYSDCRTDDSRLVVATAQDAAQRGALVLTRTRLVTARREEGWWHTTLEDRRDGSHHTLRARVLVNVAGPWADSVLAEHVGRPSSKHLRLVKGSHLVFPRLYDEPYAYLLQNVDGRVVFVIPYLDRYTLVGTTEVAFSDDPAQVTISPEETAYLCEAVNHYLVRQVRAEDAVWSYAGVRPLVEQSGESASAVSRDYALELDTGEHEALLLTVFGGKLTTYRRLAERVLETLHPYLPGLGPAWTTDTLLPGGDLPEGISGAVAALGRLHPWLPAPLAQRYARAYGSQATALLDGATSLDALGRHFGGDLYEREVAHLLRTEWAETAEDILWRRSKLGLTVEPQGAEALAAWLHEQGVGRPVVGEALARFGADKAAGSTG